MISEEFYTDITDTDSGEPSSQGQLRFLIRCIDQDKQPQLQIRPCVFYPATRKISFSDISWKSYLKDLSYSSDIISGKHLSYFRRWTQVLVSGTSSASWLSIDENKASDVWQLLQERDKHKVSFFTGEKNLDKPLIVDAQSPVTMKLVLSDSNTGAQLDRTFILRADKYTSERVKLFGEEPVFSVLLNDTHEITAIHATGRFPKNSAQLIAQMPLQIPNQQLPSFTRQFIPKLALEYDIENTSTKVVLPTRKQPKALLEIKRVNAQSVSVSFSWLYASRQVPYEEQTHLTFSHKLTVHRDVALETIIRKKIDEALFSFEPFWTRGTSLDKGHLKPSVMLFQLDMVRFMNEYLPKLSLLRDLEIKIFGDIPSYVYETQEEMAEFSIKESDAKADWFDLQTQIKIGNKTVAFEKVFAALVAKQDYVFLEDGHYFSLKTPFFDQLRQLIEKSDSLILWNKDKIQLTRYQAGWWNELQKLGVVRDQSKRWNESLRGLLNHKSIVSEKLPAAFKGTLRSYQLEGFAWMRFLRANDLGGVLADDMGLGKTVQTLAFIASLKRSPVLIVAPTSVVENWDSEIARFVPSLNKIVLRSGNRSVALAKLKHADIVVTSYGLLSRDKEHFEKIHWDTVIVDEAQFVKNHQSKAYAMVRSLNSHSKIALTGTPMENNLMELWSIFSIACPGLFASPEKFKEFFRKPIEKDNDQEALKLLRTFIRPFILRRTKENVENQLPQKTEQSLNLAMNEEQKKIYDLYLQRERKNILGFLQEGGLKKHRFEILTALMRLRQLCLHPVLVDKSYSKVPCEKIEALVEQLQVILSEEHRVIVFSQFTSFLALIKERLDKEKIKYCYLDGATKNRKTVLENFSKDATYPVFLISLKAGGVGLNLTSADYCILMDPWWNPAVEAQAVDRTHRIGQTKPVMAYRVIIKDSIEEKVVKLQEKKKALFKNVLDEGDVFSKLVTDADIRSIFDVP